MKRGSKRVMECTPGHSDTHPVRIKLAEKPIRLNIKIPKTKMDQAVYKHIGRSKVSYSFSCGTTIYICID